MGKLLDRLEKQLTTEYKQDAEDCIVIYNKLKDKFDGHVWDSNWRPLVDTIFKGFPSDDRRFKPTAIGYIFLKGLVMGYDIEKHNAEVEAKKLAAIEYPDSYSHSFTRRSDFVKGYMKAWMKLKRE